MAAAVPSSRGRLGPVRGHHRAKMGLEVVKTPVERRPHRLDVEKRGRGTPAKWARRRRGGDLCIAAGARRPHDVRTAAGNARLPYGNETLRLYLFSFPPRHSAHLVPSPPSAIVAALSGKRIAILGSTGSIGVNALEVVQRLGPPHRVTALSAHRQCNKLIEQIRHHRPAAVAVTDDDACDRVIAAMNGDPVTVHRGQAGLVELVQRDDVDIVLAAIVGAAGLPAALAAVEHGKTLALANKEALVVAGSILIPLARSKNVPILPVDSEHSAIFQAMQCGRLPEVRRVILTASGGPFRNATKEKIESATLDDALNHPTWRMGNKITIDSATMFNKALELIEACWLFDIPPSKIEIVIHPESVVHSMVEFVDHSVIAHLSPPDMRTPIQYALTYPHRCQGISRRLDLSKAFNLTFQPPDFDRFPALGIAYEVAELGGTAGAVMNAANEAAVQLFIDGRIPFGGIARLVRHTLDQHQVRSHPALDDLLEADRWARAAVASTFDTHTMRI